LGSNSTRRTVTRGRITPTFASLGPETGRRRRQALRDTMREIARLAKQV